MRFLAKNAFFSEKRVFETESRFQPENVFLRSKQSGTYVGTLVRKEKGPPFALHLEQKKRDSGQKTCLSVFGLKTRFLAENAFFS